MIEIKLSQGAKPGHGGMLLGNKVTSEIALARGIQIGKDCISPASHPEFSTPDELLSFVFELRELSGGKPVGIKLCIGHPWEFIAIVKAMVDRQIFIDFISAGENRNAGYHAAATYEVEAACQQVEKPTLVIATQSSLREGTLQTANWIPGATLVERDYVTAPAFERGAEVIAALVSDFVTSGGRS